jgi:hypothetical protein
MNNLNKAIKEALDASGSSKEANKAYLEFIKANFIIPIEKAIDDEEPKVLFLKEKDNLFLPVFSELKFLDAWADDIRENINILKLSAVDLLKGMGENVTVCLDIGSLHYKEFNPSETARMRSMVLKLFKN